MGDVNARDMCKNSLNSDTKKDSVEGREDVGIGFFWGGEVGRGGGCTTNENESRIFGKRCVFN